MVFFFFSSRRRHTRFKCDWSSDVCSSDLASTAASAPSESATSKIFPQIHAAVEAGHLLGVAIEGKGGPPRAECTRADVPFAGLAPSRMGAGRIDVGKKTIPFQRRARPAVTRPTPT